MMTIMTILLNDTVLNVVKPEFCRHVEKQIIDMTVFYYFHCVISLSKTTFLKPVSLLQIIST